MTFKELRDKELLRFETEKNRWKPTLDEFEITRWKPTRDERKIADDVERQMKEFAIDELVEFNKNIRENIKETLGEIRCEKMTFKERIEKMTNMMIEERPNLESVLELTLEGLEFAETNEFQSRNEMSKIFFINVLTDMIIFLYKQDEEYKTKITEKAGELFKRRQK